MRRLDSPLRPGVGPASVLAIVLVLLPVTAVAGQLGGETFVDRVDVPRVLVDLVVETRNGEPVLDLRREEVRLFDDGEPVEILSFSPPPTATSAVGERGTVAEPEAGATAAPRGVDAPPTFVFFIDELHLDPMNRKRLLKQLRGITDDLLDGEARALVVTFDGQLHLRLPVTRDARELREALDREMRAERMPMLATLADPSSVMQLIESRMRDETQERAGAPQNAPSPSGNDPCVDVGALARTHADQAASVAESSLSALTQLLATLSHFPGRKSLFLVSDGIPLIPGLEAYTYAAEMCDGTAARQGVPNAVDTQEFGGLGQYTRWDPQADRADILGRDMTRRWSQIAAYANAQQVTIYPIQASGLQPMRGTGVDSVRTTQSFALAAERNPQDTLFLAAQETGGEAFFNSNRFGDAVREAAADVDRVYQLSFEPPQPADGRSHEIRVEVDRPSVVVRHRRSYQALPTSARLESTVLATLFHGPDENPLAATLSPRPGPSEAGDHTVILRVAVPLAELAMVPEGGDRVGRFTVALGGRQANGRYLDIGHRTIDVRASEVDVDSQSFVYEVEVPFRSRGVVLAVAVRDEIGGRTSNLRQVVEVSPES